MLESLAMVIPEIIRGTDPNEKYKILYLLTFYDHSACPIPLPVVWSAALPALRSSSRDFTDIMRYVIRVLSELRIVERHELRVQLIGLGVLADRRERDTTVERGYL